jgi:hypothetical protein
MREPESLQIPCEGEIFPAKTRPQPIRPLRACRERPSCRNRRNEEPPFWRRASSAAGVILLRIVPLVVPIIFLYGLIAEANALPKRVDWVFYSAVQSIIIVIAVNALALTVLAPRWRLIRASDGAAARICGLVLALTLVYA